MQLWEVEGHYHATDSLAGLKMVEHWAGGHHSQSCERLEWSKGTVAAVAVAVAVAVAF